MHIKRGYHLTQINKLAAVAFISTLSFAFVGTIWAVYLESFLHNPSYVGFLVTFFTVISFLSYIFSIPLVEKRSKAKLFFFSLFLFFISYILFSITPSLWLVILLGVFISSVMAIRVTAFGIIVSDKSIQKKLSKNEGLIYTFLNLSWLIGPLIAGFISAKYGIRSVFLIAAFFLFISLFLFKFFRIVDNRKEKRFDKNIFKVLKDFFKNKDRVLAYIISGGINFWWVLIYIYIPILIIESGYTIKAVGYFLFGIIVPLIAFEYLFGKIAGKIGFRKIFFLGYLILGILAILCFFFNNIIFILFLLIGASVGGAMVESTSEAYFFDIISKKQKDKYYGIYNTTIDINYAFASFFGAIILSFLTFKFIFILFGVVMFFISFISLKIRNVIESKKHS